MTVGRSVQSVNVDNIPKNRTIKSIVSNGNTRLLLLDNNELLMSTDDDRTWENVQLPQKDDGANYQTSIGMSGNLVIMPNIIDNSGSNILLRSTDAGVTWEKVETDISTFGTYDPDYCFTDDKIVIIVKTDTETRVYYSVDNGTSWVEMKPNSNSLYLRKVTYCKGTWILGGTPKNQTTDASGLIMSEDDGATWSNVSWSPPLVDSSAAIHGLESFGTTVVATGYSYQTQSPFLVFSKDCGKYWQNTISEPGPNYYSLGVTGNGLWIAADTLQNGSSIQSTDGINWYGSTMPIIDSNRHLHEQVTFLTGEQYKTIELKNTIQPSDHYGIARTYISGTHDNIRIHAQFMMEMG